MEDFDALQGLWKIESMTWQGKPVGHGFTHYEFVGNRFKKIAPSLVDGGKWRTFTVDATTTPKRIDTTFEVEDKDGSSIQRVYKECYELDGDTLRIGGSPVFGRYPAEISDTISTVTTLSRWQGERPATKKASGKADIENPLLGTVTWNDDYDQWEAEVELSEGHSIDVSITPKEKSDAAAITKAVEWIVWLRTHEKDARAYAAQKMLELAEDWRDEDEEPDEITEEAFIERITLRGITVDSEGTASLWYNDDEIFAGHTIVVEVNAAREFIDADIVG